NITKGPDCPTCVWTYLVGDRTSAVSSIFVRELAMSMSNGSMQAALLYGPRHVALETIPIPPLGATDVLVRIEAPTTCGTDLKVFLQGGHPRMITPPAAFGHEFSGTIVQVGALGRHLPHRTRVSAH